MVWAESIWIETDIAWREARATEPGLLDGIPGLREKPDDGKLSREGAFSLVTDTGGGRFRKLPSFYVNTSQTYAHRDRAAVGARLRRAVDAFRASHERATYLLTACEIAGRRGLYGTDFFNRSAYRQKLRRLGMRFSEDPFVEFHEDGTFSSEDCDRFRPEFLTLPLQSNTPPGVVGKTGGRLVYQVTFYRIADIGPEELGRIVELASGLEALSATDPEDLAAALTRGA